jgi:putative ABC transport system permease protein
MIKNYFKIAWRNISRNRSHAIINLLGLAIGIACCILIMLWVTDELSYDKWNEKADRIYRITPEISFGGSHKHYATAPAPLAGALRSDFPEVETSVRFREYGNSLVNYENQNYNETAIIYCDSTVFDVFSLRMIQGNPKEALAPPNTLVISETIAKKYFPNEEPIGKTLNFDNRNEYKITGVIEDMPSNSHFNFDFFVSLTGGQEANNGQWLSNNFKTYYVLRQGANVPEFENKVYSHLMEKYISPQIEKLFGQPYDALTESGSFIKYHIQPMTDIHLKSDLAGELAPNGSMRYVWIFSLAALFILLIACVNFMNLSTAQSSLRAKEIGVRKVMGSMRSNLINQFLTESMVMAGLALVLGLTITQIALPYFNNLADKDLIFPYYSPVFWLISIIGIGIVGLLAGSYPAFYLSSFKPIQTLSGKFMEKGGNLSLRNSLVIFQFLIAVLMIIGTLVINQQLNFIQNKKIGFERDQILMLDNAETLGNTAFTIKNELLNNPQITNATVSGYLPIPSYRSDSPLCKNQEIREDNCVSIQYWNVDEDYISTLGMELVAGRNFSPDMPTDSSAIIINETAAKLFGFEDPIGKQVYGDSDFNPQGRESLPAVTIIGVVKDFHFESLRQNIGAVSLWLNPFPGYICLKVNTNDLPNLIPEIERTWKKMAPNLPFSHRFMDESFDQVYRSETRISQIFSIFSGLSIFIACLGLFGLAAFATERRTKEIGIRKVLGATKANLVGLMSKDFLKPVTISLIIAIPIAWYFMNEWLADFAYRIDIEWWIFALAGVLALIIAFMTVSFQSLKAASANPVDALKSE